MVSGKIVSISIDATAGGSLMRKTPEVARVLMEEMTANRYQCGGDRHVLKKGGKIEVDAFSSKQD